jgi:hypothetical protein
LKKRKLQKNWNSSKSLNRQGITGKLYIIISIGKYNKNITKIQQTQILYYCVGFSLFFCFRVLWLPTSKIQTENFSDNSFLPQQHLDSRALHGSCTIHELYKMILRWVCADHAVAPPAAS